MSDYTPGDTPPHGPREHDQVWSEMTSAFERRVRDLHEAPLTLELVKDRATRIRRARRAATAGGLVAVAALVAPFAVLASDNLADKGPRTIDAASENPTALDSLGPVPEGGRTVAYLHGTDYHRADRSVATLPKRYEEATTLGSSVVAAVNVEGTWAIDVVENGTVVETYTANSQYVVSDSKDLLAFVTTDGELKAVWADGEKTLTNGLNPQVMRASALTGGPGCNADTCRIYLNDTGPGDNNLVVDGDGERTPRPGLVAINDVSPDDNLVVAQTESTEDGGSCSAVLNAAGDAVVQSCRYLLEAISPTGDYLLASDAYASGIGRPYFAILDQAGRELARYTPTGQGFVGRTAWIDADTVAANAYDYASATWSIVTLDADGAVETVAGPEPGPDTPPTLNLAQ